MTPRYSRLAVTFHWVIALAIFVMFPLGFYMAGLPLSPRKLQLYSYHKWIGVSIFFLVWLRLAWRWLRQPPELPAHRSEEHTSELQSRGHLVCRLLLEKKKKT